MQSKPTDGSGFTKETSDSEVISSAKDSSAKKVFPQPSPPLYLSSRGLTIALVFMILTPVCLVAAAVTMFPTLDQRELPVSILLDGYHYPEEVQASVDAFNAKKGEVLEPFLTVRNDGDEPLSSLFVTVNKRFVFHASEPLAPGDTRDFYLSRLQEPDGSMFWPNLYDVRRVIVKARLPSKKQAIFQSDWASLVTKNAASPDSGEPVDETVEPTLGSDSDTVL
ncbi:MAG: hypothetical protein VX500_04910 [Planctomycetota bacterium]|jgi:hypothetical protein|nr:hypothetical protein [Planctomycetota bacterium]MEC7499587.1 hypothetical protein [Planctomycetota bacterium]MEC7720194.1 hypothetical protein [Planctomycetota bacterium]MEC8301145.1 hypothetical protein [Planctomycetota bacterium]MED5576326.1 hypothetical protein [Planctomycetota bacterium]